MQTTDRHHPKLLSLSLAAVLLAACGAGELDQPYASEDLGTGAQALIAGNGLGTNGLNRNGLNRLQPQGRLRPLRVASIAP